MRSLRSHWNHFWFEPALPDNLGLCRIILFRRDVSVLRARALGLLPSWGFLENFVPWGSVSHAFWNSGLVDLGASLLPAPSAQLLEAIQIVWRAALLFSCIGLFTGVATALSFALGVYLFGVAASFGRIHHMEHVLSAFHF